MQRSFIRMSGNVICFYFWHKTFFFRLKSKFRQAQMLAKLWTVSNAQVPIYRERTLCMEVETLRLGKWAVTFWSGKQNLLTHYLMSHGVRDFGSFLWKSEGFAHCQFAGLEHRRTKSSLWIPFKLCHRKVTSNQMIHCKCISSLGVCLFFFSSWAVGGFIVGVWELLASERFSVMSVLPKYVT